MNDNDVIAKTVAYINGMYCLCKDMTPDEFENYKESVLRRMSGEPDFAVDFMKRVLYDINPHKEIVSL